MRRLLAALAAMLPGLASAECTLNVVGLSFGNYDPFSTLNTEITGNINVSCDTETSLQVTLSTGLGTYGAREMKSGSNSLLYNLFLEPSHLSIWGDGSPGTSALSVSGTGGNYTIYGRIPAQQNAPVGSYGDTLTVSLVF